jgi:putative phosphoesterase
MKIGIISDTHDNIKNIEKSMAIFNDRKVSLVLHAGDYINVKAVEPFQGIKVIGVLGNNDVNVTELCDTFNRIGGELKGEVCETEHDGIKFAVYHGTRANKKNSLILSKKYDVVVCGHTHKLEKIKIGRTIVLNPGTANGWFFGYKATIAIFNTQNKQCEFINL